MGRQIPDNYRFLEKKLAGNYSLPSLPRLYKKGYFTTNAIESFNWSLRKITKNRGSFPTDDSMFKLLYLVLKISPRNTMPVKQWKLALNQFAILFPERLPHSWNIFQGLTKGNQNKTKIPFTQFLWLTPKICKMQIQNWVYC